MEGERRNCVNVGRRATISLPHTYTVFTRINFSLVPVRLLIEGGSYSRAAFTCAK